jgi:hypothetical protein
MVSLERRGILGGIVGAGLDNFTAMYDRHAQYGPRQVTRGAHNTYLGTWVELGIVGLALMLAAWGSHLLAASRARAAGADGVLLWAIEGACFGMLVMAVFADNLWSKEFWLPLILLTWAGRTRPETDISGVATAGPDDGSLPRPLPASARPEAMERS